MCLRTTLASTTNSGMNHGTLNKALSDEVFCVECVFVCVDGADDDS